MASLDISSLRAGVYGEEELGLAVDASASSKRFKSASSRVRCLSSCDRQMRVDFAVSNG